MPELSRFYGSIVTMFFNDHEPRHFHARYGEYAVSIGIDDLRVLKGQLPPRAPSLTIEWASIHQDDLRGAWQAVQGGSRTAIEPL
jgi:hypothetical protein